MDYSKFLALLVSLGSKVPQFLQFVADAQALLAKYADLFKFPASAERSFGAEPTTAEELALEEQVVALCQGYDREAHPHVYGAIGDGKILALLQAAWSFLNAHPELLAAILKLLGL